MQNAGLNVDGVTVLGPRASEAGANPLTSYGAPQCGPVAPPTVPDRRRITLAVVNCSSNVVHGNSVDVPIEEWVDAFLVEPSLNRQRTGPGDVYVEIISKTGGLIPNNSGGSVTTRRDVPYLIK